MSELSGLLSRIETGDGRAAFELLPLVYDELRKLAAYKMAREAPGQTLLPTALVHEAWLRLVGEPDRTFQNGTHFFNAAGEAMRRILIERARRRQCLRHGGGPERVDAADLELTSPESDERLLAVHEALDQLAAQDPHKAEVVKLRFFVGMSDREVAEALGLSERTVERYWAYSKAWLFRHLDSPDQRFEQ
ncbi:MAG: ECF-type sigma factor [Verrucomicrobiales bacterium]|nr:ECF-type sigma factor [Verrucomicrobiales bacterium]